MLHNHIQVTDSQSFIAFCQTRPIKTDSYFQNGLISVKCQIYPSQLTEDMSFAGSKGSDGDSNQSRHGFDSQRGNLCKVGSRNEIISECLRVLFLKDDKTS